MAVPPRSKQGIGEIIGPSRLAKHLDLTYPRIYQLVEEQVIAKLPNAKFDQDACRVAYLRWLRAPERRTLRIKADADFIAAKPELIAIRVQKKSAS